MTEKLYKWSDAEMIERQHKVIEGQGLSMAAMSREIAAKRSAETQRSINEWQRQTFPDATLDGVIGHLREEFQEFLDSNDQLETAVEAADLVILLYCWAAINGVDLHAAIDAKMKINRARTWNIQQDGTGRHT